MLATAVLAAFTLPFVAVLAGDVNELPDALIEI